jgi:hypothetical protein
LPFWLVRAGSDRCRPNPLLAMHLGLIWPLRTCRELAAFKIVIDMLCMRHYILNRSNQMELAVGTEIDKEEVGT